MFLPPLLAGLGKGPVAGEECFKYGGNKVRHLGLVGVGAVVERRIVGERMGNIRCDGDADLDRCTIRQFCELEHRASPYQRAPAQGRS